MNDYAWIALAAVLGLAAFFVLRRPQATEPVAEPPPPPPPVQTPVIKKAKRPSKRARQAAAEPKIAKLTFEEDDDEITLLNPQRNVMSGFLEESPGAKPTTTVFDEDAAFDEPTGPLALILVHASGQTDKGRVRKRNEDSFLALPKPHVYVVADGMGGYVGGDVASRLAVETVETTYRSGAYPGEPFAGLPKRASELIQSIEAANAAIFEQSTKEAGYRGMGTTIVAARFSPRKQRLWIAHVGDSRCYRMRAGTLVQMTVDHTMAAAGAKGAGAERLMRALGIGKTVDVDLLVAKPREGDLYLLCTDGLSKMLSFEELSEVLEEHPEPQEAVDALVRTANDNGGKDNVTVIVIRIDSSRDSRHP